MKYPNNNVDATLYPTINTLGFLYGIYNDDAAYITICIEWMYLQFKVDSSGHCFKRGKHGDGNWTNWNQF